MGVALVLVSARPHALQDAHEVRCGVEMRNVALHVADGVVLNVRVLDGEFVGRMRGVPPTFDDPQSYSLQLRSADLALDAPSLTNLLALQLRAGFRRRRFATSGSPSRAARSTCEAR